MRKRLSALLLSVLMLVTMLPVTAFAADNTNAMSGACGATESDNVTWTLTQNNEDSENPTYTIVISGNGAMADYAANAQPWNDNMANITTVVIGNGVERI